MSLHHNLNTVWHKNCMVIKFIVLIASKLFKEMMNFNFYGSRVLCSMSWQYIVEFTDFNFTILPLTVKP